MAKKLVYNYTFTPGASNVGTIEIEGNYPTKTWQLITDTGTGGTYKPVSYTHLTLPTICSV